MNNEKGLLKLKLYHQNKFVHDLIPKEDHINFNYHNKLIKMIMQPPQKIYHLNSNFIIFFSNFKIKYYFCIPIILKN